MIIVFCEFGGENLLGKAREIADSVGERVTAIVAASGDLDSQRLVYLGADEVWKCKIDEPSPWIDAISDIVKTESQLKSVLFPSNLASNAIMGAVYSRARERVSLCMDEIDLLEGTMLATKSLDNTGFALQQRLDENKVALISINTKSVPEPFEDSSRYGKVKSFEWNMSGRTEFQALLDLPQEPINSSSELTILLGISCDDYVIELARKLAKKYRANLLKYSGAVGVVYGPCVAIDVQSRLRDLPEFKSDLISLNSKNFPIGTIADVAVVNPEIQRILESML